jgi:pimeloyl-ACP methyl ester carboxylesterase
MHISKLRALALVTLVALATVSHADPLHNHLGHWMGNLKLPNGAALKIGVEIYARADGTTWASVASPDQGAYDIPVKDIHAEPGDAVVLDIDNATLKLTWARDHFRGEWRQGNALPLELRHVSAFPMPARPQTPRAPFPYSETRLSIHSRDGVTLGATLAVPFVPKHPNVVVLIAGSGPQTRHVDMFGHHMFDVLADYLARHGVAVLRYDKRGVARSTGDYYGHTLANLEDDAYAAAQALAARKQFGQIGLVGHSQGAQIAAAVAARHPEAIDFIVSLGGVGMSGLDLDILQDRQAAYDLGATSAEIERIVRYVRQYGETALATADGPPRVAALKALYGRLAPDDQRLIRKYHMDEVTLAPEMAAKAFYPISLRTDPRVDWYKVHCPVLVLGGGLDHQVPANENMAGIVDALKAGGNSRVTAVVLPLLNHRFQTARTGGENEYDQIEETMASSAMLEIANFSYRPQGPRRHTNVEARAISPAPWTLTDTFR